MINHTRTLLLNQLAVTCNGYVDNVYIDPNFTPVRLTPELQKVRGVLFIDTNIGQQLKTVMGLLKIVHISLLDAYTLYFDHRITYDLTKLSMTNYDTLLVSIISLQQQLERLLLDYNILNAVFKPIDKANIQDIYAIWSQSQETILKLGAIILAYTYQLENLRQ